MFRCWIAKPVIQTTNAYVESAAFTPGAVDITGIAVKVQITRAQSERLALELHKPVRLLQGRKSP